MVAKGQQILQLIKNMGWRYVGFRVWHEVQTRTGMLKRKFPMQPAFQEYLTLEAWRKERPRFFLDLPPMGSYHQLDIAPIARPGCLDGKYTFFNSFEVEIPFHEWLTNSETGYTYKSDVHWSVVNDFSAVAGDIKYVWEKSRFSFLYSVIRYDQQRGTDHGAWVFDAMLSWIKNNPVNAGPNYKCSQEISLRLLNWVYALHYYQHSPSLTPKVFRQLQYSIYWQAKHVYDHIHFSRIAVRNNHAITETLALYLLGSFFPQFPGAAVWKEKGKKWFETEIAYQVYEDGTFLQFSMNYHRVVIQLMSWGLAASNALQESFAAVVYERAYKSLTFLATCQDEQTGWLPNYGSNDGALFFPFSNAEYRDYRPALNALHWQLTGQPLYKNGIAEEDAWWLRASSMQQEKMAPIAIAQGWHRFDIGGYAVLREKETLTFIRCGNHANRPAQADNLHLDIWHKGVNVLHDAGTYKYNTTPELTNYFMGTMGHNTVMLGPYHQMLKGSRFIWYHWTQAQGMKVSSTEDAWIFEGSIKAFGHLGDNIIHSRTLKKCKFANKWEVVDVIENKPKDVALTQCWHPANDDVILRSRDKDFKTLPLQPGQGWLSAYYGQKQPTTMYSISTLNDRMETVIDV